MKYLRIIRNQKQFETASGIGFTRSQYNNWELGKANPTINDLLKVADYFGLSISQLVQIDLEHVGLNSENKPPENIKNVGLNVGANVGLKQKKYGKSNILSVAQEPILELQRIPKVITIDTQGHENVIMVPVKARAGYLNGYADPKFMETLPAYRLPGLNNGTYRLFEVEGASMYPTFHAGDLVIGSYVDQLRDVRDDRVYIVVTKNDGIVVKRVLNRLEKDGKLILKSDNYKDRDMYPSIICDPDDIVEIWYSTGFISRQMRPPAEVYNRLIDLEGRLSLLEDEKRKKSK